MKPTNYIDNCCRILGEVQEYPSDVYLVQLVYLQKKVERISQLLYSDDSSAGYTMNASLAIGITSLEKEIKEALPIIGNSPQQICTLLSFSLIYDLTFC